MNYKYLTGTGLKVSKLCLGTMTFGGQVNEADAIRMTHYALDQGINFIDTANSYTGGKSEELVGKAIKECRDKVILATKVGFPTGQGPNESGLSRKNVAEQLEKSLKRLGTDYIDIYYMHLSDVNTPIDEILDTFTTIVRSGKARYIGVSNNAAWQVCQMLWESDRHNFVAPGVCEMVYNMITRGIEQEFIPFAKRNKKGIVVYNPLAGGMLTGNHKRGMPAEDSRFALHKGYITRYWLEENFEAVDTISSIADEAQINMVDLAMRWCISQDHVDSIIIGFSKEEQLEQNLKSIETGKLPDDILKACDDVWKQVSGNRFSYSR